MRAVLLFFALAVPALPQLTLLPKPVTVQTRPGSLIFGPDARIETNIDEPRIAAATARLTTRLGGPVNLRIHIDSTGNPVQSVDEDESYRLETTAHEALITAPNPLGVLHALESLFQLLTKTPAGWTASALVIEDHPRFPWRGLLLDSARHFLPLDVIRRNLDAMAAVKLNVFHWHLSDDQGFRVESRRFPKLHQLGSDGDFYTQDQIRGVVQYARDRGIRVVPEFDMPGHSASWLVGYPELAAGPGPFQIVRTWGGYNPALDPANPNVLAFLETFIGEMAPLFPDHFFHVGGDEVSRHPQPELQTRFNRQVHDILAKHGKRMEGWDEILVPDLSKDVLIQSWRGAKSLAEAARLGHDGLLSTGYYLDYTEPAAKLYLVDPAGARTLGAEACMWTEYISAENLDSRLWPRTAAIAERLWSPAATRDVPDLYRRLAIIDAELDQLGLRHNVNYQSILQRLAGSNDTAALQTLTDVLEPGSLRVRHHANPNYTQSTPLDRLVDTARPDSATARQFTALVDRWLANRADADANREIRRWLTLWVANDVKLRPLAARGPALREAGLVSAALAKLASAALNGKPASSVPLAPIAEVNIAVAPAINKLIARGYRPAYQSYPRSAQ